MNSNPFEDMLRQSFNSARRLGLSLHEVNFLSECLFNRYYKNWIIEVAESNNNKDKNYNISCFDILGELFINEGLQLKTLLAKSVERYACRCYYYRLSFVLIISNETHDLYFYPNMIKSIILRRKEEIILIECLKEVNKENENHFDNSNNENLFYEAASWCIKSNKQSSITVGDFVTFLNDYITFIIRTITEQYSEMISNIQQTSNKSNLENQLHYPNPFSTSENLENLEFLTQFIDHYALEFLLIIQKSQPINIQPHYELSSLLKFYSTIEVKMISLVNFTCKHSELFNFTKLRGKFFS